MDSSCIDDISSSTSESFSTTATAAAATATKFSPPHPAVALRLYRMGSGGSSVVLDSDINGVETESRKLPSSKYKGVVPQPNGRWGAQIYEKHQRVWLGTFNEEDEAARSYDIAARRFRGRDAIVNFKTAKEDNEDNEGEMAFLEAHSKSEIVDMLRKHTYADELEQSKKRRFLSVGGDNGKRNGSTSMADQNDGVSIKTREVLFEKAVTPSDVGKLNRLVIPKQHAEKHFPLPSLSVSPSVTKGVLINFEDVTGKVWRFRYSYWNSSQSYVLTKGWSRFVKEKNLRAGDVVTFERSTGPDRQLFIDWKIRSGPSKIPVQVVVRLFGVDIFNANPNDVVVAACGGKRSRDVDVDMFALRCSKKQAIINAL